MAVAERFQLKKAYFGDIKHEVAAARAAELEPMLGSPVEAISIDDSTAQIKETLCIGCGVCAHHCPVDAIEMKKTGIRTAFVAPPKKK